MQFLLNTFISLCLITHLCTISYCHDNTYDNTIEYYKQYSRENLQAFEWQEEEWPNENHTYGEYLKFCLKRVQIPTAFNKRRQALNVLEKAYVQNNTNFEHCIFDKITRDNLEIAVGQNKNVYLASLFNAKSELGSAQVVYTLLQPITDISELQRRQAIIRLLSQNFELYTKLSAICKKFGTAESSILSLFSQHDPIKTSLNNQYFNIKIGQQCNNFTLPLGIKNWINHSERIIGFSSSVIGVGALFLYSVHTLINNNLLSSSTVKACKSFKNSLGSTNIIISSFSDNKKCKAMMSLIAGAGYVALLQDYILWIRDCFILDIIVNRYMTGINKCFENINICLSILSDSEASELDKLLDTKLLPNLNAFKELSNLVADAVCTKIPIIKQGRLLKTHKLLHERKDQLVSILSFMGMIDMYVTCAGLIRDNNSQQAGYCFACYENDQKDHSKTYINLENFWNPFVNKDKTITNSLELSQEIGASALITGPNTGGKSTCLKAIGYCALLAQTIGIVPAKKAIMKPFSVIATHLNCTDSLADGNSLFKTVVLRAKTILDYAKNLDQDKAGLFIIDELFNGTGAKEGQALAYSFARCLGQKIGSSTILATHFIHLTELEKETANYKNYTIETYKNEIGELKSTYKLVPGISNESIAFEVARQVGLPEELIIAAEKNI